MEEEIKNTVNTEQLPTNVNLPAPMDKENQDKAAALQEMADMYRRDVTHRFKDKRTATREAILAQEARMEDMFDNYESMIEGYQRNSSVYNNTSWQIASIREEQQTAIQEGISAASTSVISSQELVPYLESLRQMSIEDEAKAEMERRAYESISEEALSDPWQARVMLDELEGRTGSYSRRTDYLVKLSRLSSIVEEIESDKDGRFLLMGVVDFVMSDIIPYLGSQANTGNVDIDKSFKRWYDAWLSGERQNREASVLWSSRPGEFDRMSRDLAKNIRANNQFLFYRNKSRAVRSAREFLNTPDATFTNVMDALTNAPVAGFAVKKGYSVIGGAALAGNRKKAYEILVEATAESSKKGKPVIDPDEMVDNLTPTAVNPEMPSTAVSMSGDATEILAKGREAAEQLDDLTRSSMLTPEELEKAIDATESQLLEEIGRPAVDVNYEIVELAGGQSVKQVVADVGTAAGKGFTNRGYAERWLQKNGLEGEVVQDSSGQWFARVRKNVAEEDFIEVDLNPKASSVLSRLFLSARETSDPRAFDQSMVASNRRTRVLRFFKTEYDNLYKTVGKDRSTFDAVIKLGIQERKWYTPEELGVLYQRVKNKPMPDSFQKAYDNFIDLNDTMYALRNDAVYSDLVRKGYSQASVKSVNGLESVVAREAAIKPNSNGHIYNATDNVHYKSDSPLSEAAADDLIKRGYVKLDLKDPVKLEDGFMVREVIVHKRDLVKSQLNQVQIGYKPGFHSMYEGKYFVKQTRKGTQPDGREFLDNPSTFVNTITRGQASQWADSMNEAIAKYVDIEKQGRKPTEVDFADPDLLPDGMSTKQFIDRVEDGTYSKQHKFETVYDREMPAEYTANSNALRFFDEESNAFEGMLRTNGRTFYNGRGDDILHDHMGNPSKIILPGQTINRALNEVANVTSFGQYREEMLNRWVNTFREHLDLTGMERASVYDIFEKAEFRPNVPVKIAEGGKAQRDAVRRNLNFRSDTMLEQSRLNRQLIEAVYGNTTSLKSARGRAGQATSWVVENDPIQKLRGLAFDLKLGLFNLAQLPLQISTAVAATTISPRAGMRGFMSTPMVWSVQKTSKETFNRTVDQLIKNGGHRVAGFDDVEEFRQFLDFTRTSGFLDVSFNQVIQDTGSYAFGQTGRQFREAGRVFFNRAEMGNRTVAMRIAWDDIRRNFPKINPRSDDFKARVLGRSEDYSFNMQRESSAAWQKGWASIPTQFFSYPARMMESLLGSKFTGPQKLRLFFGQSILYGTAGIPMATYIQDMYRKKTGEGADITTIEGAIQRGIVDKMVYEMTGQDVLVGQRIGVGAFATDLIKQFTGNSDYGTNSLAEIAGGASVSIGFDVTSDMGKVLNYLMSEAGVVKPKAGPESVLQLAQNISSFNNVYRAYMVSQYNQYVSTNSKVLADDVPSTQAFMTMLSFAPGDIDMADARINYLQNRKENAKKTAAIIMEYRQKMIRDPKNIEKYTDEIALLMNMFPPSERKEIYDQVKRQTTDDFADSIERSYNMVKPNNE